MIRFFNDLLTADDCQHITRCIDQDFDSFEDSWVNTNNNTGNSRGFYDYPVCNSYIDRINEVVLKDFGHEYEFSHNFTRIYYNVSMLSPHIDRPGYDLTLSVCIYDDLHEPWPLVISHDPYDQLEWGPAQDEDNLFQAQFTKNCTPYYTKPGSGVACTREHVHWRDPRDLKGRNLIQVFYHWKKK